MEKNVFVKKLGKRIVKLRNQKGMSQADLAKACFKEPQSIERLENGKTNPTGYYLYEIAKALKIPLKELFDFDV